MRDAEMPIPHLFRCPISLELFTDPVTLCTGHTYDRPCIERWLASGNLTCPVTMQTLNDLSMVPNRTLRHLIDQWIQSGCEFESQLVCKMGPVDPITLLKRKLECEETASEIKLQALEELICLLTKEHERLVELGFFQLLLDLVFESEMKGSRYDLELEEKALTTALTLMPDSEMGCLNMLKTEEKFALFLALLQDGTLTIKLSLCQLLEAICSSNETRELAIKIGSETNAIQALINMLNQNFDTSMFVIKAILGLSSLESQCKQNMVQQGAVQALTSYILKSKRQEKNPGAPEAMRAVEQLLDLQEGKEALINDPNGIKALVKMVFKFSDNEGCESAVNSLMVVCCESMEARAEADREGVITQVLLLLQSQCSGRIKTKARMLLKLLRCM